MAESARPPSTPAAPPAPPSQLGPFSSPCSLQNLNLPPNRGLERALEEAGLSGVLNISCRKLKDFPRTVHSHDLSDTLEAGKIPTRIFPSLV